MQRGLNYAIVDEVDSILIDEARTPLIISGQADDHTAQYQAMNQVVPMLTLQVGEADPRTGEGIITPGDFTVDEKTHQVFLTEQGHENAERILAEMGLIPAGASLYDPANITLMHHLSAALRANHLYHRDQHYVLQEGEIVIVDEFTGRLMSGRRWSDGLHQAVEAKEGVAIQAENQTMASITFQNYFRLYSKLGGMTGTADTEAYEFQEIYGLETVVVPHNQKSQRQDQLDRVYKTSQEKYQAAIDDIRECHERGQPVLVGTTSIENSELISELLTKANLPVKFSQGVEGTPASFITANLVANRPNQALALKFIDMSLSESAQTCFANELRYTPTNSKAVLTPDVAATVAYGQVAMKDLFRFDAPTIEANRAGWVERWSKTIAR